MTHSESLDKLIPALSAAQAEFPSIPKDGYNPHFKSRFSTLKATQKATRPVLDKHGLVVTQFPSHVDGEPALTTWLAHNSGQFITETTVLALSKRDPQAQGGAITYLRRYAYSSVLGLASDEDDDDGNSASLPQQPSRQVTQSQQEMSRLAAAAKRTGKSKEQVEELFLKKYGKALTSAGVEDITSMADWLTEQAVAKELSK